MKKNTTKKPFKIKKKQKPPYESTPVRVRIVLSDEEHEELVQNSDGDTESFQKNIDSQASEEKIFEELNGSSKEAHFRFEPSSKYFTICIYAFFFVIAATLMIVGITKLDTIKTAISTFLSAIGPFIGGIFIAFVLSPIVEWFDSKVFNKLFKLKSALLRRVLSLIFTYLLLIAMIFLLIRYVSPQIGGSIVDLISKSENLTSSFINYIDQLEQYIPGLNMAAIEAKITEMLPQLITYLTDFAPKLISFSFSIAKFAINVLLAIMISLYILFDKRKLKRMCLRLVYSCFSIGKANLLTQTTKECAGIFQSFVFGKSLDSLIIGIICFIVLKIFAFPYAILVSVIVGITNMIPYFGPFIGAIPGILLYLCVDPMQAVAFAVIIFCIQQFDGWILGPKILGDSTGLSPLWVIFAITVGGAYGGVLGMFLGVPIVAVIAYLADRIITGHLKKKHLDIS